MLLSDYLFRISNIIYFSCFLLASVRPHITDEQEAFIHRVTEIPLDERKCQDLITLDTLHAYCGGPEPTLAARRLNAYSRRRKFIHLNLSFFFSISLSKAIICPFTEMEAARLKAQVRAIAASKKEEEKAKGKEGASSSAPKAVGKGATKRKGDGKDDHPSKKVSVTLG